MTIKIIAVSPELTKIARRNAILAFDYASLNIGEGAEFPADHFKSLRSAKAKADTATRKLLPSRFEARAHGDGFIIARVHDYTPEEMERRKAVSAALMAGRAKAKGNGAAHPAN